MTRIYLTAVLTAILGLSTATHANDAQFSALLLGKWDCEINIEDEWGEFTILSEDYYIRNGRSHGIGELSMELKIPELSESITLDYIISYTGIWEISNGFLIETADDIKFTGLNLGFDDLFDINQVIPSGISGSTKIIKLTETKFVGVSESDGKEFSCSRDKKG